MNKKQKLNTTSQETYSNDLKVKTTMMPANTAAQEVDKMALVMQLVCW